ncbi:MAG: DUF4423 domain-containing protein [Nitrospirae bacterium]|nr:DUF4423 domain-containing protein [Nitrospirota bacterium]MCL5285680.1 DUF4423 domain-containing protein [Nitrospirota bacterium]
MSAATLRERIEKRIGRSKSNVFLRNDFRDLGEYDQVGRVLRKLVREGAFVRVGYGVYVKTKPSVLSGKPIPAVTLMELGMEAMKKLGIVAGLGRSRRRYNEGESTQVPVKAVLNVKGSRITRKLGFGSRLIRYER